MPTEDPKKLVVYGTVQEEGDNYDKFFTRSTTPERGDARLPRPASVGCRIENADLFCFQSSPVGYFPALVVSPDDHKGEKPHRVRARLIDLKQYDIFQERWLFWELDRFEKPVGFEREVIDVTLADGSKERAWAYVMTPNQVEDHKRILAGDWLLYFRDREVLEDLSPKVESTLGPEVAARLSRQIHEPTYRPPTDLDLTAHVLGYQSGTSLAAHLRTAAEMASSPETATVCAKGDKALLRLGGFYFKLLHRKGRVPGFSQVTQTEGFQPDRFYAVRPAI